jgi:hypothetical protein
MLSPTKRTLQSRKVVRLVGIQKLLRADPSAQTDIAIAEPLDKQSPEIESNGEHGFRHSREVEQQMPGAWLVWSDHEDERPVQKVRSLRVMRHLYRL